MRTTALLAAAAIAAAPALGYHVERSTGANHASRKCIEIAAGGDHCLKFAERSNVVAAPAKQRLARSRGIEALPTSRASGGPSTARPTMVTSRRPGFHGTHTSRHGHSALPTSVAASSVTTEAAHVETTSSSEQPESTTSTTQSLLQTTSATTSSTQAALQTTTSSEQPGSSTTTTPPAVTTTTSTTTTITTTTTTTSTTSQPPVATPAPADPVEASALAIHNQLRARHDAPALTWSTELASAAQTWANACVFEHGGGAGLGAGENLAAGYGSVDAAVQAWYDEVADYDFNNPGFSSATGHFTQLVWVGTSQLGCAVTDCPGLGDYLVCEYLEAGNIVGGDGIYFRENVLPASA
ncbi:hypothetical protein Rhopal_002752-T1 [Rhodotorula paludigena]|uniref:SCP domain-containing protein n=1 Tax=Rhodotorula paludigena TaxID=86838 RepID=A0AAV5GHP2_9BASI|nr:hypothetical protein Rhopal_002752-T1 [Rhodotorula paludigena]